MSRESVESLIDRWVNDLSFRVELRADPEDAVRRCGAKLDEEEWEAFRNIDWSLPDAELQARASKL